MTFPQIDWLAIGPELVLAVGAAAVLLLDVTLRPAFPRLGGLAAMAMAAGIGLAIWQWMAWVPAAGQPLPFGGMVVADRLASSGRLLVLVVAALGLATGWSLLAAQGRRAAEALALMLLGTAGFSLMVSTPHLVMMFLGLEIGSLSLYLLAGFSRRERRSDEAAIKYFLLGGLASAVFIYGVSLLFAGTGHLDLGGQGQLLEGTIITTPAVIILGLALVIVGLSFKVSAAPFHSWAPDVYQGAPAGFTGFLAASAKVGGFLALVRILVTAFGPMSADWEPIIAVVATLSMVIGSLGAIVQDDVRRLLAYSGVAHAGFILTGVMAGGQEAASTVWFYLAVYVVQVLGAFAVVAAVSGPESAGSPLSAYRGLSRRSPYLAATFSVLLLGMAGLPLTSGFVAKFGVFQAAWTAGFGWLVVVAVLTSVIALYLYLRVIVAMYMGEAEEDLPLPGTGSDWVPGVAVFATLLFGLLPGPLLDFASHASPL
jgi:NADH-quinone oxidoreductase subunit N